MHLLCGIVRGNVGPWQGLCSVCIELDGGRDSYP